MVFILQRGEVKKIMNIKKFLVGAAAGALMLGATIIPAFAAAPNWDTTGTYTVDVVYLGVHYPETLDLSQTGGNITGTSLNTIPPSPGSAFTVTGGTVSGDTVDIDFSNDSNPGLTVHFTGTIVPGGSMGGTWQDTPGLDRSGTWQTTSGAAIPLVNNLSPVHAWVGLKNSDDQGTQFDVFAELLKNGSPVATGLTRCVTGITRNPSLAKEVIVNWDAFSPFTLNSGDTLAIRLSTRVGTTSTGAKCAGPGGSHNNAVGLRVYYDSISRNSSFDIGGVNQYLHANGNACNNAESVGATNKTFNGSTSTDSNAKCKDSSGINFSGGNLYKEIGTWGMGGGGST